MPIQITHTTITRRYHFESAHHLPHVPEGHKCKRLHGHNYVIEVTVASPFLKYGFVIDFWDLDKIVQPIVDLVDHQTLNDISGLENPTAEVIAGWFANKISKPLKVVDEYMSLKKIRIYETRDCWADVSM